MRTVLLFPYNRRHSLVANIVACLTDEAIPPFQLAAICEAVDEGIARDAERFGFPASLVQQQSERFWQAVQVETGLLMAVDCPEDQPA